MRRKKIKYLILIVSTIAICYFIVNAIIIYQYSNKYYETKCDVAIVLGAATNNNKVSPVYKERINHAIYLYNKGIVQKIILTGGIGKEQVRSDSEVAKDYVLSQAVPSEDILTETKSTITIENLSESKLIMDSLGYSSALIVSDPLHMKRAMMYAKRIGITCEPSPTKTSMYKSFFPKSKSLLYETFFYSFNLF